MDNADNMNNMNKSLDDNILNKKWHYSTTEYSFVFYFDSTEKPENSENSKNPENSDPPQKNECSEYRLVLELDDTNTRYVNLKRKKNKFESLEVEMDDYIEVLGGPVYSYKILLKFNKNGDISPVSTLYIRRKQDDTKMIALGLEILESLESLESVDREIL